MVVVAVAVVDDAANKFSQLTKDSSLLLAFCCRSSHLPRLSEGVREAV